MRKRVDVLEWINKAEQGQEVFEREVIPVIVGGII